MPGTRPAEARAATTPSREQPAPSEPRFSLGRLAGTCRRVAGQGYNALLNAMEQHGRTFSGDHYYHQAIYQFFPPDSQ